MGCHTVSLHTICAKRTNGEELEAQQVHDADLGNDCRKQVWVLRRPEPSRQQVHINNGYAQGFSSLSQS